MRSSTGLLQHELFSSARSLFKMLEVEEILALYSYMDYICH